MSIERPASFEALDQGGLVAFAREQVIGLPEEWKAAIKNGNHLYAYVCREVLFEWTAPSQLVTTLDELQIEETNSSTPQDKLIVPYEISAGRYGQSLSLVNVEVEHKDGAVRVHAQNEARSSTYGVSFSDTTAIATRTEASGTISLMTSGSSGVIVIDMQALSGRTHELYRVWVQIQEIALIDLN